MQLIKDVVFYMLPNAIGLIVFIAIMAGSIYAINKIYTYVFGSPQQKKNSNHNHNSPNQR